MPIKEVRDHVNRARKNGVTLREIAVLCGIDRNEIQRISRSPKKKSVRRSTYKKVMEGLVDTDLRAYQPTTMVPIKKALQVSNSLSAQGWSKDHQKDIVNNNTDATGQFIRHLAAPDRAMIQKQHEDIMLWLEKVINTKVGPGKKCKTWARKNGYFPLKHYDAYGDLSVRSLSAEQRAIYRRVQSSHD